MRELETFKTSIFQHRQRISKQRQPLTGQGQFTPRAVTPWRFKCFFTQQGRLRSFLRVTLPCLPSKSIYLTQSNTLLICPFTTRYAEDISFPDHTARRDTIDDITTASFLHAMTSDLEHHKVVLLFYAPGDLSGCFCHQLGQTMAGQAEVHSLLLIPYLTC